MRAGMTHLMQRKAVRGQPTQNDRRRADSMGTASFKKSPYAITRYIKFWKIQAMLPYMSAPLRTKLHANRSTQRETASWDKWPTLPILMPDRLYTRYRFIR